MASSRTWVPALVTDDEAARFDAVRARGGDVSAWAADIAMRRRWWREVGEYLGLRQPVETVEVR